MSHAHAPDVTTFLVRCLGMPKEIAKPSVAKVGLGKLGGKCRGLLGSAHGQSLFTTISITLSPWHKIGSV